MPKKKVVQLQAPDEKALSVMDPETQRLTSLAIASVAYTDRLPVIKNGVPTYSVTGKMDAEGVGACCELLKTQDLNTAMTLIYSASAGFDLDRDAAMNRGLAGLAELKPSTHLEAMLCAQIVATNAAIAQAFHQLTGAKSLEQRDSALNMVTRLQRIFLTQVELLEKLRGKGQQHVTVEHIHVNAGGQAIVGNVAHGGPGGRGTE